MAAPTQRAVDDDVAGTRLQQVDDLRGLDAQAVRHAVGVPPFGLGQVEDPDSGFEKLGEIPMPDFWGGYRIVPERIEFWQGGPNRLHDRFLYSLQPDGGWGIEQLQP